MSEQQWISLEEIEAIMDDFISGRTCQCDHPDHPFNQLMREPTHDADGNELPDSQKLKLMKYLDNLKLDR